MTQPAKVQEPSMEEILASIRRIIADDEAKPPAAEAKPPAGEKPAGFGTASSTKPDKPASPKPVVAEAPPLKAPAAPAAAKPAPAPSSPAPGASNSQDDIDALLNGLDEATTEDQIRPSHLDNDVFELTDDMAVADVAPPPSNSFKTIEPRNDIEFAESPMSQVINRSPAYEPPAFDPPPAPASPMLSQTTISAVESAFSTLANTVLSNNARTLEDLVREMLRPMLKSWLDDNLPGLVERIVKAEIERVARGR